MHAVWKGAKELLPLAVGLENKGETLGPPLFAEGRRGPRSPRSCGGEPPHRGLPARLLRRAGRCVLCGAVVLWYRGTGAVMSCGAVTVAMALAHNAFGLCCAALCVQIRRSR